LRGSWQDRFRKEQRGATHGANFCPMSGDSDRTERRSPSGGEAVLGEVPLLPTAPTDSPALRAVQGALPRLRLPELAVLRHLRQSVPSGRSCLEPSISRLRGAGNPVLRSNARRAPCTSMSAACPLAPDQVWLRWSRGGGCFRKSEG